MSGYSFKVPPRKWAEIADLSDQIRRSFDLSDEPEFPIMELLEEVLYQKLDMVELRVSSVRDMGASEGHTCPKGSFIELREDVYEDAWRGDGRARFTAAHELGHLVLHTQVPLARAADGEVVPPYRCSEAQANRFAAELLMPPRFFHPTDDAVTVADRHKTSLEAARIRLKDLRGKGAITVKRTRAFPPGSF